MTYKSETSGATQSANQEGYTQTFTMVNNKDDNGLPKFDMSGTTLSAYQEGYNLQWWTMANHEKENTTPMI